MAANENDLDAFGGVSNRLQPRVFGDLRGWIDALRAEDEIQEIDVEVCGRDSLTGLPRRAVISSGDVREALQEPIRKVIGAIKSVLERTPPELAADRSAA